MKRSLLVIAVCLACGAPALAAGRDSMLGIGYTAGAAGSDRYSSDIDFGGATFYGKIGFGEHTGLMFSYRAMEEEDLLAFFSDFEYEQYSLHGVHLWRARKVFRPYVKFGLTYVDFEEETLGLLTASDDGVGLSAGWGMELGGQVLAFLLDWDYSQVELFDETARFVNVTFGIALKL